MVGMYTSFIKKAVFWKKIPTNKEFKNDKLIELINNELNIGSLAENDIAVFCGAGLSLASGLPLANGIKRYILEKICEDRSDIEQILDSKMPFETFMEIVLDHYAPEMLSDGDKSLLEDLSSDNKNKDPIHDAAVALYLLAKQISLEKTNIHENFLQIFTDKSVRPNLNHIFLAKLAKENYVKTILTTNFDLMIEKACLDQENIARDSLNIVYKEDQISAEYFMNNFNRFSGLNIFKIHGSADDFESVRATLSRVANHTISDKWEKIIEYTFKTGPHKKVIVLGYSCSDYFDINPSINRLNGSLKEIILIQHNEKNCITHESLKSTIFNHFQGSLIRCRTEDFVRVLWENNRKVLGDYSKYKDRLMKSGQQYDWKIAVEKWSNDLQDRSNEFTRNFIMSMLMASITDNQSVIKYTTKCLGIAEKVAKYHSTLPGLYNNLSVAYGSLGMPEKSELYHKKSLEYSEHYKKLGEEARSYINIADIYIMNSEIDKALESYNKALKIAEEIKDDEIKAYCYCNLANIYNGFKDYEKAKELANNALDICAQNPNPSMMRVVCRSNAFLSMACVGLDDFDAARKYGDEALKLSDLLGDDNAKVASLIVLADSFNAMGNRQYAIEFYKKALPVIKIIQNTLFEAPCCVKLSMLLMDEISEREDSFTDDEKNEINGYLERALQISRELNNKGAEGEALILLGILNFKVGQIDRAQKYFHESEPIFEKEKRNRRLIYGYLQTIYVRLGMPEEAEKYRRKSMELPYKEYAAF